MPPKYGKLDSFPSHNFDFHEDLSYQGVIELISDNGYVIPNLVKELYVNFSVGANFVLISKVKNTEIALSLEDLGQCLNVPCVGQKIQHILLRNGLITIRLTTMLKFQECTRKR